MEQKSTVVNRGQGKHTEIGKMKTKKEIMDEMKWELAVGKYIPYYQEYLA
jgi:hypothetical protein